ncbi:unnamed protein product [Moneuplotes crassus]|uniref:Uncharacterized protein n=1 Tax=Euplotes crassus TaxID=5936 RepID=A0AAD1U9G4_EUPCR|nr:unnamed protein product [Moneuplotes crassus]
MAFHCTVKERRNGEKRSFKGEMSYLSNIPENKDGLGSTFEKYKKTSKEPIKEIKSFDNTTPPKWKHKALKYSYCNKKLNRRNHNGSSKKSPSDFLKIRNKHLSIISLGGSRAKDHRELSLSRNTSSEKMHNSIKKLARRLEDSSQKGLSIKRSLERSKESIPDMPDLSIFAKSIMNTERKWYNIETSGVFEDADKKVDDYCNDQNLTRYSVINKLLITNRKKGRKNHSVKRRKNKYIPLKRDQGTETEEPDQFMSLLEDPSKIEKIIRILTDLKDDIIKRDLEDIKNQITKSFVMNKIQDFSDKCMEVIKKQQEIIKKLSKLTIPTHSRAESGFNYSTEKHTQSVNSSQEEAFGVKYDPKQSHHYKIDSNLYKELVQKLKVIIASKDKELESSAKCVDTLKERIKLLDKEVSELKKQGSFIINTNFSRPTSEEEEDHGSIYSSDTEDVYCMKDLSMNNCIPRMCD